MFQPSPVSAQASLLQHYLQPHLGTLLIQPATPYTLQSMIAPLRYPTQYPQHPLHYTLQHKAPPTLPLSAALTYGVVADTVKQRHLPDQRSASRIPPTSTSVHLLPAANSQLPVQARHHRRCRLLRQVIRVITAQVIHPDHSKSTRATDN